jgi:hypothetical protein
MMQLHLDEISRHVAEGAHAVLLLDSAGWHTTGKLDMPENITAIFLPSRAPELNPVKNVWQYLPTTGSQTPSSKTTTQSSTPPGANSSPSPKPSHPSERANGLTSVSRCDLWYQSLFRKNVDALFAVEREINGLSAATRLAMRQEKSAPLIAAFEGWMSAERVKLSRHAAIAKAID